MKSVLIKDTTRAQREEIGLCATAAAMGAAGAEISAAAGWRRCTARISRESGSCGKSTSPIGQISFAADNKMLAKDLLRTTIYVTYNKLTWFCRKEIMSIRQLPLEKPVQSW